MYEKTYVLGVINTTDTINTEEKVFTPTTSVQTYTPTSGTYISKVTVNAISTETKTVTPTAASQSVTPTSGKFLSSVTVNPIPNNYIIPSGTKTITENGTHDVSTYANVEVNVASSGGGSVEYRHVFITLDASPMTTTITSMILLTPTIDPTTYVITYGLSNITIEYEYDFYVPVNSPIVMVFPDTTTDIGCYDMSYGENDSYNVRILEYPAFIWYPLDNTSEDLEMILAVYGLTSGPA